MRATVLHPVRRARGLTLVELMVGLAVGLFISLVAIAVFVSTRTLNTVSTSGTRMGENARLAMEALQDDLRSAGFQGCHHPDAWPPASQLNSAVAADEGFLDVDANGVTGVAGHRGTGTAFAPLLGAALQALVPPPDPASDVITVRVPTDNLALGVVAPMPSTTAAPQVGTAAASTLRQGDIVLVADCRTGDIFQVTSADPAATGNLEHNIAGSWPPGNATPNLQRRYQWDASVYKLQTRHYYVAPSVLRQGTKSLWRFAVPCRGCTDNPVELASGVDRLNITWGIDTDGDEAVNRYVGADGVAAAAWPQVMTARVQMLVATTRDGMAQTPQTVTFAGSAVTAGDRRLRTVLTEVVTLRNRAP